MKLYEHFADRGFHTTVITTFGVDFDAYESIALSRLRGSGCHNNVLVADERMLSHALDGASVLPQHAGRLYSVIPARAAGVFHTKIILQFGRKQGRLIIGSANTTASGLAGNLELAGLIQCEENDSGEQRIIAAGWHYLSKVLGTSNRTLSQQIDWMRTRTPWLSTAEAAGGLVELADGRQAAFLGSGSTRGIIDSFIALVEEQPVDRLVVLSPYWDDDLSALKELASRLTPRELLILIDRNQQLFPGHALDRLTGARLLDIGSFGEGRFIHAKMVLATTPTTDHVLFGSANCTIAALGNQAFSGRNHEACLYRRLPSGSVTEALNLNRLIAEAEEVNPSSLSSISKQDDLPLEDLATRSPGQFECMYDTLVWWPPKAAVPEGIEIEILGSAGHVLPCSLKPLSQDPEQGLRFQLAGLKERPAFARVIFANGTQSALAIVSLVDALRNEAKEARTKRVEGLASQLEEETEEGLWLLEILDELESSEAEQSSGAQPVSRKPEHQEKGTPEEAQHQRLDYETFLAGRRLRSEGTPVGRNSLAGSEISLVRNFLNRVLAMELLSEQSEEPDLQNLFDLGDEVSNAEEAIEGGAEFAGTGQRHQPEIDKADEEAVRKKAARRRENRSHIAKAVKHFGERIRSRAKEGGLTPVDILRLRAILTIVASAGWAGKDTAPKGRENRSTLQVLPISGSSDAWPMLLGQTLFSLFSGNDPAVRHLNLSDEHDQIPDDILECWACCFWCVQACLAAVASHRDLPDGQKYFQPLAEKIYRFTGLNTEELKNDQILDLLSKMSDRFACRLGLNAESLTAAHNELTKILSAPSETATRA